jgi:predicted dehydrogenase
MQPNEYQEREVTTLKRLRIGIVGCGEVSQIIHLPALEQLSDKFHVTALCDISPSVLEGVGERWSVENRFTEYTALIEQADVDAVLVANPHAYHAQVLMKAIEAGKHVMVEKPMCMTLREADEIIASQRWHGVTVQVGYMRRYAPAFTQACELVRQLPVINLARVHDVIGMNSLIIERTSRVIRGNDVAPELQREGTALQDDLISEALGDVPEALRNSYLLLLGLSSHDVSAMREMLGTPNGVLYAASRNGGRYISAAFDYGDFVCQFETGVDDIPRFDGHIQVFANDAVIKVQYDTPYVRNLPTRLLVTRANGGGGFGEQTINPAWGDPFMVEWESFYDNVIEGQAPKTDPCDFRRDLELFEQMIAQMR